MFFYAGIQALHCGDLCSQLEERGPRVRHGAEAALKEVVERVRDGEDAPQVAGVGEERVEPGVGVERAVPGVEARHRVEQDDAEGPDVALPGLV